MGKARDGLRMSIASPCVNVCRMNADNTLCVGCHRTLDEIAQWSRASDDAKAAILAAVEKRRTGPAPAGAGHRADANR